MNKIAIMGAMPEEIAPLLEYFKDIKATKYASNVYYETSYNNINIVIAYSKIGKVFSALTTTILIEKFKCDIVLFSGVAGAINKNLKIGDIVVATKTAQHDLDITSFGHEIGFVPEGSKFINMNKKLINIAIDVAKTNNISLKKAIVATGDQFVAHENRKKIIFDNFQADAIEMEGASVAVVCHSLNIPLLIIRSISDTADTDAGFDFDKFLDSSANISAKLMITIVAYISKNIKKLN